jgi:hypothetical protein
VETSVFSVVLPFFDAAQKDNFSDLIFLSIKHLLMPSTNAPYGYNSAMALLMAQAVSTAYYKYQNPDWPLTFGQFKILPNYIQVHELDKYVFFGFAATGSYTGNPPYYNIIALRGTQSDEEAFYDVEDFKFTDCMLPRGSSNQYGQVSTGLYDFYTGSDLGWVTPLADSFKSAVASLDGSRPTWYLGAHSLGGAMAALGALDAVVCNSFQNENVVPQVYTYGGLNVGDADFANAIAQHGIVDYYRVVNLADFVPSLTGIQADTPGYQQPGQEYSFLWQTGADWGNHSLDNVYIPTLQQYANVIKGGPRKYPQ